MLLADMELAVRQDLNDLDSSQYRWASVVLDRCIARALREYSFVWPRIQGMVMPCSAGVRAYPLPVASSLAAPAAPGLSLGPSPGSLSASPLYVRVSAATLNSESAPSVESQLTVPSAGASVLVSIPPVAGALFYNVYVGGAAGGEYWNGQSSLTGPGAYTVTSLAPPAPLPPSSPSALAAGCLCCCPNQSPLSTPGGPSLWSFRWACGRPGSCPSRNRAGSSS